VNVIRRGSDLAAGHPVRWKRNQLFTTVMPGKVASMDRGSSKHSARVDEQMNRETLGILHGVGGRAEEWKMAEPAGEDQPEPARVMDETDTNDFSRFGRYIGLSALPGDRAALRRSAATLEAPDDIRADLDRLPEGVTYRTVAEIWAALGHGPPERAP
jgi:hypothetical protein